MRRLPGRSSVSVVTPFAFISYAHGDAHGYVQRLGAYLLTRESNPTLV